MTVNTSNLNLDLQGNALQITQVGIGGAGPGNTPTVGVYAGTSVPTISAPSGSLYLYQNADSSGVYVNQSVSSPGTTWTAITIP